VTVKTDRSPTAGWEITENDYGDLWVFHTHPSAKVPAYVVPGWDGGTVARCSTCMAYLELDGVRPLTAHT
jgi:hypothetical protein